MVNYHKVTHMPKSKVLCILKQWSYCYKIRKKSIKDHKSRNILFWSFLLLHSDSDRKSLESKILKLKPFSQHKEIHDLHLVNFQRGNLNNRHSGAIYQFHSMAYLRTWNTFRILDSVIDTNNMFRFGWIPQVQKFKWQLNKCHLKSIM